MNDTLKGIELAQIGWVVPDIEKAITFLSDTLGISGFPKPELARAQDLNMSYYGKIVDSECLTSQTYNGSAYIELIQPLSGKSMFSDYLEKYPLGGVQHLAFRLPVDGFEKITSELRSQGYEVMSEVDHPIARMAFFDTYEAPGVATEIMGITPEGWEVLRKMEGR